MRSPRPGSETAARELLEAGFRDVWNLSGGMVAWERAGLSLIKP